MKKCPFCAEAIQDEAVYCRYCNQSLNQSAPSPQSQQQASQPQYNQQLYTSSTSSKKTTFCIIGIICNIIIAFSLFFPVFTLRISSYIGRAELSPFGFIDYLTNYSNYEKLFGSGPAGLLAFMYIVIAIFIIISIVFFVRTFIALKNMQRVLCVDRNRYSIIMLLVVNAVSILTVFIWNGMMGGSSGSSSYDYFSSMVSSLVEMEFPTSAFIFIVLSIIAIIVLANFESTIIAMNRQEYGDTT